MTRALYHRNNHGYRGRWNSKPWRIAAWSAASALMLVPIGVQLVHGSFGWSPADFFGVAVVLLIGCFLFDIAARKSPNLSYLMAASGALAASFGTFVVNGAVGFVGSEDELHNLLFLVVIFVALIGAVLTAGRPEGMARAMLAAAITHIIISSGLLIRAGGVSGGDAQMEIVGLSIFAALWLASAWLFRTAAR